MRKRRWCRALGFSLVKWIALQFGTSRPLWPAKMADHERKLYAGLSMPAWSGIVLGVISLGGLFYFLATLGPKRVSHETVPSALNADQWKLSGEIEAIEKRYREHPPEELPVDQLKEDLARAIVMQEQLLRINPNIGSDQAVRLERLLMAQDTLLAWELWPRINDLEKQLHTTYPKDQRLALLGELLELRRKVNQSRASARYKDLARETLLERELTAAQAEPMKAEVQQIWSEARAAAKRKDWMTALDGYTKAREIMDEVNQRFARTRFADIGFQTQLSAAEESLQGAYESAEVEVLTKGGDTAAEAGESEKAAGFYAQAIKMQQELNESWPKSRFASTNRPELLETKRQSVLAAALLKDVREQDVLVDGLLGQRRTLSAVTRIEAVQTLFESISRDYPQSSESDAGLGKKYAYLMNVRERLRELQDMFYEQMVPLPRNDAVMLMRDEVDQKSYVALMRFNPSRMRGDGLPVDSVSWTDAREFCRRLGWIMGKKVRLPRSQEISQALGERGADDANGFINVESNLAEWLDADDGASRAQISQGDREANEAAGPEKLSLYPEKKTQSERLGFRVMVEVAAP